MAEEESKAQEEEKEEKPTEEALKAVTERIKFFFSNANLRGDKFMQKLMLDDEEIGFSKPLKADTLLKFNSVKQHTESVDVLLEAAQSLGADFLTVDMAEKTLKRTTPMLKSQMDDNIPLSVMVENLKVENDRFVNSIKEVEQLFEPFGKIAMVRFRWGKNRHTKKSFARGNCMVEWEEKESQEKAMAKIGTVDDKEPSESLELAGNKLKVIPLRSWIDTMKAEKEKRNAENGDNPSKRKREDADAEEEEEEAKIEFKEFTLDWKKGCVVQLKGLGDNCDREAILDAVKTVKEDITGVFADFSRGQTDGAVRFPAPCDEIATLVTKLNAGELEIASEKLTGNAAILDGEEEEEYWKKFIEFKNKQARTKAEEKASRKRRKGYNHRGGGGRGRGRGGRGGGRR